MKPSRESLTRILRAARTAPPPAESAEQPLPPGTATRIAARWAASASSAWVWERLSYAGLAVALLVSGISFSRRPVVQDEDPEQYTAPDLFTAVLTEEPVQP